MTSFLTLSDFEVTRFKQNSSDERSAVVLPAGIAVAILL